jgi:hypothetical protein
MPSKWIATFALLALAGLSAAAPTAEEEKAQAELARVQRLLDEPLADATGLDKKLPLAEHLGALQKRLPKAAKLTLSLDNEGLGKDLTKVADAKVAVTDKLNNASLRMILHRLLKTVPGVDYAVRPGAVVITRTRLAAHRASYFVTDVIDHLPALLPLMRKGAGSELKGVKADDGEGLLARIVSNAIDLQDFESLEVENGARLVVTALPRHHAEIESLLEALRRMADVAVVINARLYEIDRTVYAKHVAPLFVKDQNTGKPPAIASVDTLVFRAVTAKGKALLSSEEMRLRSNESVAFLSKQSVFRYDGGPGADEKLRVVLTGKAGVSFRVRPQVSADRRFVHLEVTQHAAQLVGIEKTTRLDASSGKRVVVESPNLRRATHKGTVRVPDAGAFLMPVDYAPPDKGKVWVLVARPYVWIEEEEVERRNAGRATTAQDVWDSDVAKDDE